ncbi:hypothetical protein [Campylobacter vulpis]|uniref:hypothetical protein n=1 Tax=Campylobacter vulpis TaxID=1655500 RepID=UPI000C1522FC|nr:hypothetical protein [Campylobacter vulpis]MBS4275604.1 hypothetical protein [Campylobacter vulpis]MBS4306813.1 hypothetical protein [Campylobacter vulpis]MBS4329921.1 hypothetical protein [Campylobacter vulpis]MBS4423568.1 hypothetical protein [Campylobacter vulpis]PHY89911.1 hypothetical protein AA995_07170 [Campylobacter vulpis]
MIFLKVGCKGWALGVASLKGKIRGFCVSKRVGTPLGFGSFRQNRNFADEKNIKKIGKKG